jgi:hypothetical protein
MKSKTILAFSIATTLVSAPALHSATESWYATGSSGNWDTTTTGNWVWGNNPFQAGDRVYFELPGVAKTVNIIGTVSPSEVWFGLDGFNITGGTLAFTKNTYGWPYIGLAGHTDTISSYIDSTAAGTIQLGITGVGGTLNLGGGGTFTGLGQGGVGQTLSLTAGTYTVGADLQLNNAGTLKFTIGSGVMLNVGGQLTLNHWDGTAQANVTNNNILDFATTGPLSGNYVIASYGSLYGSFGSATHIPSGYAVDYAYNNGKTSNNIALVAIPEPSTWMPLLGGLGMLTMFRRRRA